MRISISISSVRQWTLTPGCYSYVVGYIINDDTVTTGGGGGGTHIYVQYRYVPR